PRKALAARQRRIAGEARGGAGLGGGRPAHREGLRAAKDRGPDPLRSRSQAADALRGGAHRENRLVRIESPPRSLLRRRCGGGGGGACITGGGGGGCSDRSRRRVPRSSRLDFPRPPPVPCPAD